MSTGGDWAIWLAENGSLRSMISTKALISHARPGRGHQITYLYASLEALARSHGWAQTQGSERLIKLDGKPLLMWLT